MSLACRRNTYLWRHPTNNSPTVSNLSRTYGADGASLLPKSVRNFRTFFLVLLIMPLDPKSVPNSMYVCGFLCPNTRQDQNELLLKRWFFLPKTASSISRSGGIFPSVVQAYTQPYSFGGRIKLIICQFRHELSVTIHEISTSWKNARWRTLYIAWDLSGIFTIEFIGAFEIILLPLHRGMPISRMMSIEFSLVSLSFQWPLWGSFFQFFKKYLKGPC